MRPHKYNVPVEIMLAGFLPTQPAIAVHRAVTPKDTLKHLPIFIKILQQL
jgi:hypothetical protein